MLSRKIEERRNSRAKLAHVVIFYLRTSWSAQNYLQFGSCAGYHCLLVSRYLLICLDFICGRKGEAWSHGRGEGLYLLLPLP